MSKEKSEPKANSPVSSDQRAAKIVIKGNVQGVFYRTWTQNTAIGLHLKGYVRNEADGSVEIIAEGTKFEIDSFVGRCHQGPQGAQVQSVQSYPQKPTGQYQGFEIEY